MFFPLKVIFITSVKADNKRTASKGDTFMLLNRDLHSASQTYSSGCTGAVIQHIARQGVLTCTDSAFATCICGFW